MDTFSSGRKPMICPNCGTENSGENRYCARCKVELQVSVATLDAPPQIASPTSFDSWVAELVDENLIDPEPTRSAFSETFSETELWPNETVFVPTAETPGEEAAAEIDFEDEEADDFFEQSLSGGLRRSDLATVEESGEPGGPKEEVFVPETSEPEVDLEPEIPEPEIKPESETIPEPEFPEREVPAPEIPELEILEQEISLPEIRQPEGFLPASNLETQQLQEPWIPVAGQVVVREVKVAPTFKGPAVRRKRRLGRTIVRVCATLVFAALLFGAGLATGFWMLGIRESQVPRLNEAEVVVEKPPTIVPPSGMVYVPGGEFQMGSDTSDVLSRPAHRASVGPFFIDVTEVTNEAYLAFVNATDHTPPAKWKDGTFLEGEAKFPVTGLSWYDAVEYAAWAGKRLPTEAEWEFAARGNDERTFPWGNEWDVASANADNLSRGLRNVGEGGRSPFGLFDMAGNAWEWTKSDAKSYPGGKEFPWSRLKLKIIRGGNWQSGPTTANVIFRGFYGASGEREYDGTGFRCVKDLPRD